jgi:hypothetical protein
VWLGTQKRMRAGFGLWKRKLSPVGAVSVQVVQIEVKMHRVYVWGANYTIIELVGCGGWEYRQAVGFDLQNRNWASRARFWSWPYKSKHNRCARCVVHAIYHIWGSGHMRLCRDRGKL